MGKKLLNRIKGGTKKGRTGHDSVAYHLHKQLDNKRKARSTKIVHASEMQKKDLFGNSGEFCPREYALLDILNKTRPDERIKTCSQMVFNFGNKVADILIETLGDARMVIGDWECAYCEKKYKFQQRPIECKNCEHDRFDYIECRFTSVKTDQSCGVDMFIPTLSEKYRPVEIKSIKDEEFKKLDGPLAEHKWRTNLYMRIIADSKGPRKDKIITDEAVVIYVSKGGYGCQDTDLSKRGIKDGPFSPFKEYVIKRDDKATETKWYHAQMLKEFRDGKRGMVKGICPTSVCNRAKSCTVAAECFSNRYKGED